MVILYSSYKPIKTKKLVFKQLKTTRVTRFFSPSQALSVTSYNYSEKFKLNDGHLVFVSNDANAANQPIESIAENLIDSCQNLNLLKTLYIIAQEPSLPYYNYNLRSFAEQLANTLTQKLNLSKPIEAYTPVQAIEKVKNVDITKAGIKIGIFNINTKAEHEMNIPNIFLSPDWLETNLPKVQSFTLLNKI